MAHDKEGHVIAAAFSVGGDGEIGKIKKTMRQPAPTYSPGSA